MSISHDLLEESTLKLGREIGFILNRLCDTDEKVGYMLVAVEFGTRKIAISIAETEEDWFTDTLIIAFCIIVTLAAIAGIMEANRHFKVIQKQEREKIARDREYEERRAKSLNNKHEGRG